MKISAKLEDTTNNTVCKTAKLLLLTKQLDYAPKGGREMLSKLNHDALSVILGEQLVLLELTQTRMLTPLEIFNAFRGNIDGLTSKTIEQILQLIQREHVSQVFVDGSNLGGFVSELKRTLPEVEIITFFHNVEVRFFWGALRASKTFRALAIFIVNYLAERKATLLSDKRICLSERDSVLLQSIYGSGATHIAPMALIDKLEVHIPTKEIIEFQPFALFVGGNFYANREGILWFVKNVARRIDMKVCIVGKGMEEIRAELEIPGKVEVIGSVENLGEWYNRAKFVIAPIFDGSGMKTKVAEALMHGKKVIGTPEAFSGYEAALGVGWVCRTADDFVAAVNEAQQTIRFPFDPELRAIYVQNYSFEAAKGRLKKILI